METEDCSICLETIKSNKNTIIIGCCKKKFHTVCLLNCIIIKNECPLCRSEHSINDIILKIPIITDNIIIPVNDINENEIIEYHILNNNYIKQVIKFTYFVGLIIICYYIIFTTIKDNLH